MVGIGHRVPMPKKNPSRRRLSAKEIRDLDIEITFLSGLVRKVPDYVEALQILGDDYTRRGRFEEGLDIDQRLQQLLPEDPLVLYNLACSYSLTGQMKSASEALRSAIDRGYRDFDWLSEDPDLQDFRQHDFYREIHAKIQALTSEDV